MFLRPQVFFLEEGKGTQACQVPGDGVQQEEGNGGSFKSMFFELNLFHGEKKNPFVVA